MTLPINNNKLRPRQLIIVIPHREIRRPTENRSLIIVRDFKRQILSE